MNPAWQISSFCGGGACVGVVHAPNGDVHVTNTQDPDQVWLVFDAGEWRDFLAGVKAGEFDA